MEPITPFSDEQLRALVNLRQRYEVWLAAERRQRALPYDLRIKTVGSHRYLYEIADRSGNGRSLGRLDDEKLRQHSAYREEKKSQKARLDAARAALREAALIARAARVPLLASDAGEILREADVRELLGESLLVAGTNCMIAYAQEAGGRIIEATDETQDFDLAWSGSAKPDGAPVWDMLKAVDPTFTVNSEREFQARNASAYEVELLVAPSRAGALGSREKPRPLPLPEQEWLLLGRPVVQVAACRDGTAARIIAPDPRWFALHKLWLSAQAKRDPLKRRKDRAQGMAVLDTVAFVMPQFPLDAAFQREISKELEAHWREWNSQRASSG